MSATAVETSLVLHVEQIIDGEAKCHYCGEMAVAMIGNGANPELKPQCVMHAREWLRFTGDVVEAFLGKGW